MMHFKPLDVLALYILAIAACADPHDSVKDSPVSVAGSAGHAEGKGTAADGGGGGQSGGGGVGQPGIATPADVDAGQHECSGNARPGSNFAGDPLSVRTECHTGTRRTDGQCRLPDDSELMLPREVIGSCGFARAWIISEVAEPDTGAGSEDSDAGAEEPCCYTTCNAYTCI